MNHLTNSMWLIAALSLVLGCTDSKNEVTDARASEKSIQKAAIVPFPDTQKPKDRHTEAADKTCECMQPMIQKARLLKHYQDAHQTSDVKRVSLEMTALQPQITKCSDEIREKYGRFIKPKEDDQMLELLKSRCPDIVILFSYVEQPHKKKASR